MDFSFHRMRPSILHLFAFSFFAILILIYVVVSGDVRSLIWALPTLVFLLIIPMLLSYMSQSQYSDLIPMYEESARDVRIREINESMVSKPIRIEGLVEQVRFRSLNRPHFVIGDKTGEIVVKMFTNPRFYIEKGDIVEVYGQVIRRYIFAGDPVVNGIDIRVIDSSMKDKSTSIKKGKKKL